MPNGQDRYADKARKRSPRKGRTIRMGKKLGAASVEGRIEDVARELLPLMSQLSEDSWKRLDKWAVALAKARGITPDPNVIPQVEAELVRFLQDKGVFNDSNDNDSEPKVTRAQQLAGFEQRERKASEYYRFSKAVEDLENMLESARAEGKPEFVALLEERLAQLNAPGVIEHWDKWSVWVRRNRINGWLTRFRTRELFTNRRLSVLANGLKPGSCSGWLMSHFRRIKSRQTVVVMGSRDD